MTAARKQWTEEHQHQLKGARQQAGVSDVAFARDNAIALRQLQQLEEGGSTAFYSESIKYDMGAKLLKRLGRVPHRAPAASDDTVPDLTQAVSAPIHPAPPAVDERPDTSMDRPRAAAVTGEARSHVRLSTVVLSLVGVGLIATSISLIPSIQAPGATQGVVQTSATAPAAQATPSNRADPTGPSASVLPHEARAGQIGSADPASVTPAPPPTATAPTALAPASPTDWCSVVGSAQSLVPTQPSKSADYVYLTAGSEVSLCVRDAAGQVTRKSLQAGQSVNVPGQQPFEVTGDNLSQLRVFFQGQRIWFQPEATRLRLTAATSND